MMLPFFEWCEASALGQLVRTSVWLFPVIEAFHLVFLCALGGAVLLLDLRMLGTGIRRVGISDLAADTHPWLVAAVVGMFATGIPMFLSEALKCYYNPSFWVKMSTLPIALLFAFVVRRRVARQATEATAVTRTVAAGSLALWFVVAAAGRWIGFSS